MNAEDREKIDHIIKHCEAYIANIETDGDECYPLTVAEHADVCILLSEYEEQAARIAELEEKLRWRDCKTEPPTKGGVYIVKQAEDGQPWFDIFRVDIGWENAWNGGPVPHSWRPIE